MKLSAVAIMEVEGVNFKVLNYQPLFKFKNKEVFFSEKALKEFLKPLSSENFPEEDMANIELGIKKQGYKLSHLPDRVAFLAFKNTEKHKIYLQKEGDTIFGFLLYQLSSKEMNDIKNKKIMGYSFEDKGFKNPHTSGDKGKWH